MLHCEHPVKHVPSHVKVGPTTSCSGLLGPQTNPTKILRATKKQPAIHTEHRHELIASGTWAASNYRLTFKRFFWTEVNARLHHTLHPIRAASQPSQVSCTQGPTKLQCTSIVGTTCQLSRIPLGTRMIFVGLLKFCLVSWNAYDKNLRIIVL